MKNKKLMFGTVLFLFVLSGICNIVNISAFTDSIYMPPHSYVGYEMGYLESGDQIVINNINSDNGIIVYIMQEYQYNGYADSGGVLVGYEKVWINIVWLSGWSFDITEDDVYYILLENNDMFTGRSVEIDITVDYYTPFDNNNSERIFWAILTTVIILSVISSIVIILVKKYKKKAKKETIFVQKSVESLYCSNCGAEHTNINNDYCSKCGSVIRK